jgi:hypothetical protein
MLTLTLLPDVRTTLLAAFRTADLVRIDFSHPFTLKVKEEELIDFELVDYIRERVEELPTNGKLALSEPEMVFLYTLLDLSCKSYFTSFAEILEREYKTATRAGFEAFIEQRGQLLGTSSRLLAKFRERVALRPGFVHVEEKLAALEETMS